MDKAFSRGDVFGVAIPSDYYFESFRRTTHGPNVKHLLFDLAPEFRIVKPAF